MRPITVQTSTFLLASAILCGAVIATVLLAGHVGKANDRSVAHAQGHAGAAERAGAVDERHAAAKPTLRPIVLLPKGFSEPPSLAPGRAVAIPDINFEWIDDVCTTRIHAQNTGHAESTAVLVVFGEHEDPCGTAPGPIGVTCSPLLAPGSSWIFAAAGVPAGSKSGFVYSISGGTSQNQDISDTICAHLQTTVGDDAAFRDFHSTFLAGGNDKIAGLKAKHVQGEPHAVVAHRVCPADLTPGATVGAAFEGVSESMYDLPTDGGSADYQYQIPLTQVDRHGYNTSLYIQNASATCATVELVFRALDSCAEMPWCFGSLEIAPGQALSLDPLDCLPAGWQGNVEVSANTPLAIAGDIVGRDAISSFRGVADGAGSGSTELFGPLAYSAQQGWDTEVYVQNLGSSPAQAQLEVYNSAGAIESLLVQTICPKGSTSFLVPVIHNQPGHEAGWIRVASQPHANEAAQALEAVAWLTKYSDPARTEVREASAYNLLHVRDLAADRMALPMVYSDLNGTGLTTEVQLALTLDTKAGSGDIDQLVFDATGSPPLPLSTPLEAARAAYRVLASSPVPAEGLQGSILARDQVQREIAGGAGIVRRNTRIGEDIPGDEAAIYIAIPSP